MYQHDYDGKEIIIIIIIMGNKILIFSHHSNVNAITLIFYIIIFI